MKIALVHDYLKEFGGAERVLRVLADMFPQAPIYTAFKVDGSLAGKKFADRKIYQSGWASLIKRGRLYSPLRFLLPWIWGNIDLSDYDLVITSCSGYIARGFKRRTSGWVVAYCHTPPRFLYGFITNIDWQKYLPVRFYGYIINHFLRQFDWRSAQQVDIWLANSVNVQKRIKKFYRRESQVVYPPVMVSRLIEASRGVVKKDYFLVVSRLVGAKGLEETVVAMKNLGKNLKIVGGAVGRSKMKEKLIKIGGDKIEFLGRVSDKKLLHLYAEAKGFIALARDEDFGMTVVESQAAGTPVIAFNGGGFKESVKDGKTGILINDTSVKAMRQALIRFDKIIWHKAVIQRWVKKFSRQRFENEIMTLVKELERKK